MAQSPEARAIRYLAIEVPKWTNEHQCFSCHNNGDAARALILAVRSGDLSDRAALAPTLEFLARPERWDHNGPDGPFKDKHLARLQFASALSVAVTTGITRERRALDMAAALVADLQSPDGSWPIDALASAGSPATYGPYLATAMACRTLGAADRVRHARAIAKAENWFAKTPAKSVLGAAATILAYSGNGHAIGVSERARLLELIRQGQGEDGGWGPFVTSPSEAFDTALCLLALAEQPKQPDLAKWVERGRNYLVATQREEGSWPATTRPSGVDSYAQQISTSGWAAQALLATRAATRP